MNNRDHKNAVLQYLCTCAVVCQSFKLCFYLKFLIEVLKKNLRFLRKISQIKELSWTLWHFEFARLVKKIIDKNFLM